MENRNIRLKLIWVSDQYSISSTMMAILLYEKSTSLSDAGRGGVISKKVSS